MSNRIVSNTGPLIGLALIDRLDLLQTLYAETLIPDMVHQEMLQGGEDYPGVAAYRKAIWIQRRSLTTPGDPALHASLDAGEAAVIQLARESGIQRVLIDERKGRKVARVIYHLDVIGTAGMLVSAKRQGLLANVREALVGMCAGGYRIHPQIIDLALREAGEI
jgi:predicted nucleic acid-binding protein